MEVGLRPSAGLAFLEAIHAAFYRDNRDVTREDVAVTVAEEFGFQRREFAARLASEEIACATLRDHALARATGITGFPSVLGRSADGDVAALTIGYQSFEALMPMMTSWLKTASIGGAGRARANRV